ncbi:MAG: DUF5348 domain-containing protein [Ruthenibacterium sp.]
MKYGTLFFDTEPDRINVEWEDGSYGDGFRCGDVVNVRRPEDREFVQLRLEYDPIGDEWYFADAGEIPYGTEIRAD